VTDKLDITSEAISPDDELDEGLVALLTPEDAGVEDDVEDDDALEALQEDLSPGEAARVLETMRPLDAEERKILDDMPELRGLRRVDDPAEEEWLAARLADGYQAMDKVLDDSVFGDTDMNNDEELLEQNDTDSGWSLPGLSKIKKYAGKGLRTLDPRWQYKKARGALALVKKFVPGRDRGKAAMVKRLNNKLVVEHANWLAIQDQRSGRVAKPRASYVQASKQWARQKLAAGGLPTTFAVRGADVLGADILGSDVMGAWWNPLSWFQEKVNVVVNQTQGERSATGPQGQPMDPSMDPSAQDPYAQDPSQDPYAQEAYPQEAYPEEYPEGSYGDLSVGIAGEDSLGAASLEILSGKSPAPVRREDQLAQIAAAKLAAGRPLSAGEVAVLATLAKAGHPLAKKLYSKLFAEGVAVQSDSGAWTYMLNPANWFKSSKEREFRAKEIDAWKENAELQKQLKKRGAVLEQAERAKTAAEAVAAARAQAAATEAQLKAIEASLSGALVPADSSGLDALIGHEKPTAVAEVLKKALDKLGKRERASKLYAKIARGEALDKDEMRDARTIAKLLTKVKVVHGDLREETPPELAVLHGAFVGACMRGEVGQSLRQNALNEKVAVALAKKIARGEALSGDEKKLLGSLLKSTINLQQVARGYVSGESLKGLKQATGIRKAAFIGAVKAAMTPEEKKMLSAIVKMAKAGNPRAQKSLEALRKSGAVVGGDHVGLSYKSAFDFAMKPITLPAKHLYQAAKWTGKKLGIVKSPASPEQARLSRMRAAAKRRAAAVARARAADAQTEAELRAQQSIASAADAEAEAADAAALAQEAAMRTKEIEADPEQAYAEDDDAGSFVGSWQAFVGDEDPFDPPKKKPYDPAVKDPFETAAQKKATLAARKKLIAKAGEKSPTGSKIRAGAALYAKAKKGDPQAKRAVQVMVAKAKKGDPQAKRDVVAVAAGKKALKIKQRAQKKEARALARQARNARVVAVQRKIESGIAQKIVKVERRIELKKLAVVERRAARGDKKAVAYVQKQVAAAKKGDKKATSKCQKLALVKKVRLAAPTKRERRNLAAAGRVYAKASKGDRKAVRQIMVVEAAAKKGNPNAKRAVKRLALAKVVFNEVEAGKIVGRPQEAPKKQVASEVVARAESKLQAGTGSREEYAAGARAAQSLGDRETAGNLAVAATRAPSATETLKKTATVVAAKEAGNAEAKSAVAKTYEEAKQGDAAAIKKMGNVVAVQTLDDVNKGRPVPEAMRDAVNIQARAAEGDPEAIEIAKKVSEAATGDSPSADATAAAITLTAAAVTAKALAAKPKARQEYLEKVNAYPAVDRPAAEQKLVELTKKADEGTITAEEGAAGVRLAERLGKPKVAARIAAEAPPAPPSTAMSSLPDQPLPPITGTWSLIKESLRALTLATPDPLANYRQGVASRARAAAPAEPASSSGWSPFAIFRKFAMAAPIIAPATAMLASAASLAMAVEQKRRRPAAPAPAPVSPAPVAQAAPAAPAVPAPAATVEAKKIEDVEGDAPLPAEALARARQEAEDGILPPEPESEKRGKVVRRRRSQAVSSASGTIDKTFRDHVVAALKAKKISRADFNKAVDLQAGLKADTKKKLAVGQKILEFFAKKSIKVEV
jgi:hypothetical protein